MKLQVYIHNHVSYIEGEYDNCFTVVEDRERWDRISPEWVFVQEVEVELVDTIDVTQAAVTALDEQITNTRAELQAKVNSLETRKANLLAITHQSAA